MWVNGSAKKLKPRNIAYYSVSIILSVLLLLLVVEMTTRSVSWLNGKGFSLGLHEIDPKDESVQRLYQWHPFAGVIFRPFSVFQGSHPNQDGDSEIFVDANGFLADPAQPTKIKKETNELRIAAVGASTTANVWLSYHENWPGRLGLLLEEQLKGYDVSVVNAGVPGFDTSQSIGNLALRVMPLKPDVVVIYHAYNDLKAVSPHVPFSPDYSHIHAKPFGWHVESGMLNSLLESSMFYVRMRNKKNVSDKAIALLNQEATRMPVVPELAVNTYEQHMRALIGIARSGGAQVIVPSFATLHDPSLDYLSKDIVSGLSPRRKQELPSLLYYTPGLTINGTLQGVRRYNEAARLVAEELGAHWVDTADMFGYKEEYFADRVHFSREGAQYFAEILAPVALDILRQKLRTESVGERDVPATGSLRVNNDE